MPTFLLRHRHDPDECRASFAAWKGFDSPLRRAVALGTCHQGGHELLWQVQAVDAETALLQLPPYVAQRTQLVEMSEVRIP